MIFEIRHRIVGHRLRLAFPALQYKPKLFLALQSWMKAQPGVSAVQSNQYCASITLALKTVRHDEEAVLLAALGALTQAELRSGNAQPPAPSATGNTRRLAIAAAGMLLSFVPGPINRLLAALAAGYAGLPSCERAWQVARDERRLNVDFLDSLALVVALVSGRIFTAAAMTFLINVGDAIRDRTARRSARAISSLLDYQRHICSVLRDGTKVEVAASEIIAGDEVVLYAGNVIPVDGTVTRGMGLVDQRTITGESMPVDRRRGGKVYAGTLLQEGHIVVRAKAVGADTTVARVVQMVEQTPIGETRVQNYAEKFADRLVAPSLALALGLYGLTFNVERLLSMAIVDYGTGIRVSAPTAILASIMDCARRGILIKSGSVIEQLAACDTWVFDKTGTVTRGAPRIMPAIAYDERHFPSRMLLALAASAEMHHKHPVAHSIVNQARGEGIEIPKRTQAKFRIGYGVEAKINGWYVHVGNERFLRELGIAVSGAASDVRRCIDTGYSPLFVSVDGKLSGLLPYADEIRAEMPGVIRALRSRGTKDIVMLTGDNAEVARAIASEAGITNYHADVLPADKARIVRELRASGSTVAMVGDGINDSPALAAASVGISVKNGTDVTREVANVVLMDDSMTKLVAAVDASRDTLRLIGQNYALIASFNTLALALAIPTGMVSPGVTALLSNGSAILASLNSIRPILDY